MSGEQEDVPPLSISGQIGHFIKWKRAKRRTLLLHEAGYLLLGLVLLATVTGLYFWLDVSLVSAAFTYLGVLVLLSLVSTFYSLIVLSFICVGCLSYFFAPPIYSFRVDYPQDLTTIAAFVITSFIVSFLVTRVRIEQRDHMRTSESLRDANKRLETTNKALRENEYNLHQIIDAVPSLLWSNGPDGEPTRVSQRMLNYSGMPFEDFKHRGWGAFVHPADFPETAEAFYRAIQSGTSYEGVMRLRRADGEFRWHHARCEPLRDRQGNIIQWYGLAVEIDERKKAEDLLRHREAYLAEAQRLSHTGTWVLNPTTMQYLYWSDESYRIWAFDPLQGFPSRDALWQRIHPDDRDKVWEKVQEALRQKKDYSGEFRIVLPNGTVKYLAATSHHLFSTNGELVEVIGTNVDVTERKRAEEALRSALDGIAGLVVVLALNGEIESVNRQVFEYFGRSLEWLKNWGTNDTVHPEDLARTIEVHKRAMASGNPFQNELRLRRSDGEYRWFDTRHVPIRDDSGRIVRWYVLATDIEERKRAEDLLRRSEAHLAEAQRLSHTGAVAYNGTAILFASEETYRIWGFDPAQGLPGREVVFQRIHPGDRDWLKAEVWRAVGEKRRYSIAYRILLPDGTVKHLETIGQPVFSASGKLVEIFATQTDVTERKRAEEALRESEAKFRDYAETASDWFWEIGSDYKYTLLTENAFGSSAADRIGKGWWDHALDLETEPEKWGLVWETLDSRKPFRDFVYRILGGNGSPMYVKASGQPVFNADGEFRGYRGTGTDVTALVRAQEEHERLRQLEFDLAHMNRVSMMGELAASLSHEITQPIASARNNARAAQNFLDMQPPDLSELREALGCVVGDTDRAGDIVDRIRDHIKKTPPRKEHFDLNEAIDEVIVLGQSAIIKNGVWVQTRLAEGLSPIHCDRVQLQQVVLNLILNAAEAMGSVEGAPRDLSISTEQYPTGVLVAVRDSGPGIDPTHLERVFEAFYTTKSRGVGMGLSICRSIIDAHGGRLWAEANEPRGTIFQFTLPGADSKFMKSPCS
jgi:PAS domain S-box-containing protein